MRDNWFWLMMGLSISCSLTSPFIGDYGFSIWAVMFWFMSVMPNLMIRHYAT